MSTVPVFREDTAYLQHYYAGNQEYFYQGAVEKSIMFVHN